MNKLPAASVDGQDVDGQDVGLDNEWQRAYKHAVTDCKYTIAVLAA